MAATAQDSTAPLRGPEKKDEDREEETEYSPFYGIEKGAVLQEARIFNDSNIDARRCQQVITKLLYLVNQGETFTKKEASEVFFSSTKLFQNRDTHLRRMVYLCIKEIAPSPDEAFIVVNLLMKDMNSKVDLYRSNSVRVLRHIAQADGQILVQLERLFKQGIVDKSPVVASAVLASGLHLMATGGEVVKRWVNEIQEAVQSKSPMVQFHALALLHALRSSDRLAVSKLVATLTKTSVKSPLAQALLVRYVGAVVADSQPGAGGEARPFYDYLQDCLRHKTELVIFEAARSICGLRDVSARELQPAITVLQLFLSSSKPVLRFAAVRTLNRVAQSHPLAVANCNIDMESLIADPNRSIATLAITTLLKTGNEQTVDKLIKQIGGFMSDIPDDSKVVVVDAVRAMCLKYPAKHRSLMAFLSNVLREEGGFEYKKAIVASILQLIQQIPDAKEPGLAHLCEFIEDCEFTFLSTQILHLLGVEGPASKDPSKYIRYIYNRIILENATVRAAAVSSLASFVARDPTLKDRVVVLLRRALYDNDDEVRDRATVHLNELEATTLDSELLLPKLDVGLPDLESSLQTYLAGPTQQPFDLETVPKGAAAGAASAPSAAAARPGAPAAAAAAGPAGVSGERKGAAEQYEAQLNSIPEFAGYGKLFHSSSPVRLTEEDTEYEVNAIKHVFEEHLVFQFNCTNTIKEQVLEDVTVVMDLAEADEFEEELVLPLKRMPLEGSGATYTVLRRPAGALTLGRLLNILKFTVKEIDPTTGEAEEEGYEDEYQLEDLEVGASDYLKPIAVSNFRQSWEGLPSESERADDYDLGRRESLQDVVETVITMLGMQPCEGSEAVPPNARSHTVLLAGLFVGNEQALVRLSFGIDAASQVKMKVVVRADSERLSEAVHAIVVT